VIFFCLFKACKSFCEELIRRGHVEAHREGKSSGSVNLDHVIKAVVANKRLAIITNQGLADRNNE
jgi:hypothetical protein